MAVQKNQYFLDFGGGMVSITFPTGIMRNKHTLDGVGIGSGVGGAVILWIATIFFRIYWLNFWPYGVIIRDGDSKVTHFVVIIVRVVCYINDLICNKEPAGFVIVTRMRTKDAILIPIHARAKPHSLLIRPILAGFRPRICCWYRYIHHHMETGHQIDSKWHIR